MNNEPPEDAQFFDELDRQVMLRYHAELRMLAIAKEKALIKKELKALEQGLDKPASPS
jgi:hypothetical protein